MNGMTTHDLKSLAGRLLAGQMSLDDFLATVQGAGIAVLGEVQLDLDRHRRCGFPEVVFAQGKTVEAIEKVFTAMLKNAVDVLATRMTAEQAALLAPKFPEGRYNPVARTFRITPEPKAPKADKGPARARNRAAGAKDSLAAADPGDGSATAGRVTIVTAGTSDLPVAEEARETALWTGAEVRVVHDVGVAGPHRLRANLSLLEGADAGVAGMEGALPSVVGGYVACPVVAVPTSVGYGASFGGVAALLGMLNSCASNVTVVNIDAGFKGGYVAGLIARNAAIARRGRD
jgi:NCAIR mutase (PurE)-related protein